jgi:hypothetical protein
MREVVGGAAQDAEEFIEAVAFGPNSGFQPRCHFPTSAVS